MPTYLSSLFNTAVAIADRAVVADIETEGARVQCAATGTWWLDISNLLSDQEHAPETIDMNSEALAWAFARQLIQQHPKRPLWVRVVPRSPALPTRACH